MESSGLRFALALPMLLLATSMGCGDDEGVGVFSSGLPAEVRLDELSPEQIQQICAEERAFGEAFIEANQVGFCLVQGTLVASRSGASTAEAWSAACDGARQQCEAASISLEGSTCRLSIPDVCNATIAELERCFTDRYLSLTPAYDWYAAHDCRSVLEPGKADELNALLPLDSVNCLSLEARCPGIGVLVDG